RATSIIAHGLCELPRGIGEPLEVLGVPYKVRPRVSADGVESRLVGRLHLVAHLTRPTARHAIVNGREEHDLAVVAARWATAHITFATKYSHGSGHLAVRRLHVGDERN